MCRVRTRDISGSLPGRVPHILLASLLVVPPCLAADEALPPTDLERLAASRATWEKARDAAGGHYSYEVSEACTKSRQTTRVVVKQGRVVERSFEQFVNQPGYSGGKALPTLPPRVTRWTETEAEIGRHGDGAAPPLTVDELYDEAAKVLAAPRAEFRQRSLGFDDHGFLEYCVEYDDRIAGDVPLGGVKPFRITIGLR